MKRGEGLKLALALVLFSNCAALRRTNTAPLPVKVLAVAVDFPTRDRGSIDFTLELPPDAPPARSITWELFLDGVRFAAGLEGQLIVNEHQIVVRAPLVSRHLAWREGEGTLDVGLKGEIDVGTGVPLGFKERRELPVTGRPVWTAPE
ncbi:MAG: hypothetical protein QM817_20270 [Archangium sp.]